MKKSLYIALIMTLAFGIGSYRTFAADDEPIDDWQNIGNMQDVWDDQKVVTDDEFEKIIEQRTKGTKQQQEKQEKKFKKKYGEAIVPPGMNPSDRGGVVSMKELAIDYPTLLVPKVLVYDEQEVPIGYYRVIAAKSKQNVMTINFYQGNSLIAKIPAQETADDFGAETINYAKIIYAENDNTAKIVYGCLDYNLIAYTGTK